MAKPEPGMPGRPGRLPLPRHVTLVGPTASGKTGAALAVAQALQPQGGAEIISMDSALVYRGMDVGTAKPTAAELAQVPHHLINIRDPLNAYSAAEFARDAQNLMAEITARGKLPLLVGGTMLYYKALVDGLDDMPPANPALRAEIEAEARANGWPALHQQLQTFDPLIAARLAPNDSQRISRAVEVYRLTGRPLSSFHATTRLTSEILPQTPSFADSADSPDTVDSPGAFSAANVATAAENDPAQRNTSLLISLEPAQRTWLHDRIGLRLDAMQQAGFLDEMRTLRDRGDLHADLPAMRCVGYRQAWDMLDGRVAPDAWRELAVVATRQLAKRQLTWLRSLPHRVLIPADSADAVPQVLAAVMQFWWPGERQTVNRTLQVPVAVRQNRTLSSK